MPKKENIETMFNNIAHGYTSFNHLSSFYNDELWRRRAMREILRHLPKERCAKILDLATGTADFAITIAKRAKQPVEITGIDISEGMLAIGRERSKGLPIKLISGDATELPFADGSFGRVCVAFGLRNFENLEKGLSEMKRVLAPGGRAVILELSYPKNAILLSLFKLYAGHILPIMGKRLTGERGAFNYLTASIMRFPLPDKFIPMLKNAGFGSVEAYSFTFGTCRMYVAE